jgi:hypothetical protein
MFLCEIKCPFPLLRLLIHLKNRATDFFPLSSCSDFQYRDKDEKDFRGLWNGKCTVLQ